MWYFSAGANIGYQTPNVSDDNGNAVFIINREAIAPSTVAFSTYQGQGSVGFLDCFYYWIIGDLLSAT